MSEQQSAPRKFELTEERKKNLDRVSFRLLFILLILVSILGVLLWKSYNSNFDFGTITVVFLSGILGGLVSIQRRLKSLDDAELGFLAHSWFQICLAPFSGGLLAILLYMIFLGNIISGELFPEFTADSKSPQKNFRAIFEQHTNFVGYAKLVFWSFVAGFSQNFVTGIIERSEKQG